jgi:hypothetical protein
MIASARVIAGLTLAAIVAFATPAFGDPTPSSSLSAVASPAAAQRFSGQVLDVERGYIVFSTGAALRLAPDAMFTDLATGQSRNAAITPGQYAEVTFDPNGLVTAVSVSDAPIPTTNPMEDVPRAYIVQATAAYPNPDLIPPANLYPVSKLSATERVTITVDVPPQTPFSDDVYMATETSGWNPQAVKLQRIDGRRFRVSMDVSPGTHFRYLFTRGSWASVESDAAGLRRTARTLNAQGGVSLVVDDTIRRWVDLP